MALKIVKQFIAGADLTGKEGLAVYCNGSSSEVVAIDDAATTDEVLGIIQKGGASGTVVDIVIWGECDAIAGGAVEPGDWLTTTTGGKLVPTGATANAFSIARYFPPVQRPATTGTPAQADGADTRRIAVFLNITKDANPGA